MEPAPAQPRWRLLMSQFIAPRRIGEGGRTKTKHTFFICIRATEALVHEVLLSSPGSTTTGSFLIFLSS